MNISAKFVNAGRVFFMFLSLAPVNKIQSLKAPSVVFSREIEVFRGAV